MRTKKYIVRMLVSIMTFAVIAHTGAEVLKDISFPAEYHDEDFDTKKASSSSFMSNYVSRVWGANDGLLCNTITDIIQDSNGFLYIGTYDGLIRFDGLEFKTFNASKNKKYNFASARTIMEDSKNNLWVGSNDEGVFCIKKNGDIISFTNHDGLPNNSIRDIEEDLDGNIWIGTAGGIAYIGQDNVIHTPTKGLEEYGDENMLVADLYCDTTGRIWVTTQKENALYVYQDFKFSRYAGITKIKNPIVNAVSQDKTGALWFGVSPNYAVSIDGSKQTVYTLKGDNSSSQINSFCHDSNSNMWISTHNGVAVIHDGQIYNYDENSGLVDNKIVKVIEDTEKNIWFATKGGLQKLGIGKFRTINMGQTVNAIGEDTLRNLVWIGTDTGLFCYDTLLNPISNALTEYVKGCRIRHIEFTEQGNLLISTYDSHFGQLIVRKDGTVTAYNTKNGLAGNKTRCAIETKTGDFYVGTTTGLSIIDGKSGKITSITKDDDIANEFIMCLYEAKDGTVWCGTDGGGVFLLKDRKIVKTYNTDSGLAGNVIFKIANLQDDELWISTGTGLSRLKDNQIFNFDSDTGFSSDSIFQVIKDVSDRLWMTTNMSIFSTKLEDLKAVANGETPTAPIKTYGFADGLVTDGITSTSLSMKDRFDRMWFTLIDGFAVYDPVKAKANMAKPLVLILEISIDNKTYPYDGKPIILPPDTKRIDIKYTGVSFIASEKIQFSHRLSGFDKEDSIWSTSRVVSYTNLNSGNYVFSVKALNSEGIESDANGSLIIKKEPHYYELWYFRVLFALATVLFILLCVRLYISGLKAQRNRLEKEVAEKTKNLRQKSIALEEEKNRSEKLLLNILPKSITKELSENPGKTIAKAYPQANVLFADIVNFTNMASSRNAIDVVEILNALFTRFDLRAEREGIEKIKTIGDCYMAANALCETEDDAAPANMVRFAQGMFEDLKEFNKTSSVQLNLRIGIHTGNVIAGVIGKTKFLYDIWGDTVNVASRMQSTGQLNMIHVSQSTYNKTRSSFNYINKENTDVKGKGEMTTYFLDCSSKQ